MSSWEASLAVTGNEMKRMMSYSQTRMLMNVFFCGIKYLYSQLIFTNCTLIKNDLLQACTAYIKIQLLLSNF